jgi:phosphoglycolate phosphatase-like HAD superfamily hydrolase
MDFDPLLLGAAPAKGKRPWFFQDPDVERLLNVVMALAMELAVTRQRLDALERLLAARGLLAREAIENFAPSAEEERERQQMLREFQVRLLRIFLQEAERARAPAEPIEKIMEELSATAPPSDAP